LSTSLQIPDTSQPEPLPSNAITRSRLKFSLRIDELAGLPSLEGVASENEKNRTLRIGERPQRPEFALSDLAVLPPHVISGQIDVLRFLSKDWSPWIALLHMRERWPELRFEMKAGYLQMVGSRKKRRS
jgi:hypothetical protein